LTDGEPESALACCRKALTTSPGLAEAYELMINILMPGDGYLALLEHLHESLQPETYLEIGVGSGASLALAKPRTRAVGVDPAPAIRAPLGPHARVYELESDEFFSRHYQLDAFQSARLDLAFIDGLHQFEQTLNDFANVERQSHPGTVVLLHDCLPVARLVAARSRRTGFWCGDVWKAVTCLREQRPDLDVRVVPAPPSGLAIVTHLDAGSTLFQQRLTEIVSEYRNRVLDYEYLDFGSLARMAGNGLPNDWRRVCEHTLQHVRTLTSTPTRA